MRIRRDYFTPFLSLCLIFFRVEIATRPFYRLICLLSIILNNFFAATFWFTSIFNSLSFLLLFTIFDRLSLIFYFWFFTFDRFHFAFID